MSALGAGSTLVIPGELLGLTTGVAEMVGSIPPALLIAFLLYPPDYLSVQVPANTAMSVNRTADNIQCSHSRLFAL
jgi:hypothetical protein